MKGRTYRYFKGEPLYPFGFGLSYSSFVYDRLTLPPAVKAGEPLPVTVDVTNTGPRDADEIVQVYLSWISAPLAAPLRQLAGFQRVFLKAGQSSRVSLTISDRRMSLVDEEGTRVVPPGRCRLSVGGRQPDSRSEELARTAILTAEIEVTGTPLVLPA